MVPLQIRTIKEQTPHKLENVKKLIIGGAALRDDDLDYLEHLHNACYASYGMTETVSHIALQRLNGVNKKDYFEVLPGVIIDEDDRGCLSVKGVVSNGEELITNDVVKFGL